MSLAATGELVAAAHAAHTAVLALNVITLEHAEAVVAAAAATSSPAILQLSQNAARYHDRELRPILAACAALADTVDVPIALHLDHIDDPDLLRPIPSAAVSSAMVDASTLPYEQNVSATRELADELHAAGRWVEAELGEVGGKDGAHTFGVRTDPDDAAGFVAATGVDALAVAVGSSHAMTARTASLDLELIARIAHRVPVPLVLHGSSGVPTDQLRAAAAAGVAKINVGTALNVAFTRAVRAVLTGDDQLTDPRKYLRPARDAARAAVAELFIALS